MMDKFLLLFVAAVVGEGTIEYLVAPVFDWLKASGWDTMLCQQLLRFCSCALGIIIAWQLQLAFFQFAFGVNALNPWFDITVTGVAIGRGSNYVHDLIKKLDAQL